MHGRNETTDFYASLPCVETFGSLTNDAIYAAVPDDWVIGTADIEGSTRAVAQGRYKAVNMAGAAVISAMINARSGRAFPFVFGGDGAGFAVPQDDAQMATDALGQVRRWALDEFDFNMRAAVVPVGAVRAAGFDVRIARFAVSPGVDYAMFAGGGLYWAETQMKAGAYAVDAAPVGSLPDLTGLSCRWSHMPARHGTIASLVISPVTETDARAFASILQQVVAISEQLDRSGHPAPAAGPGADWPPAGATLEAHAARGAARIGSARRKALFESFVAWALIKTGVKLGGFDARRYQRVVGENADFRKLDDGLKMTLDCDPDTLAQITQILDKAQVNGVLRYGMTTQSEAMMTCIVPSILTDDHVHFIDGADGGYTQAAAQMKNAQA